MTNSNPINPLADVPTTTPKSTPGPWQCLVGSFMAGGFATAFYFATVAIAKTFAHKPIHTHSLAVANIMVAVRTLVVGMSVLGTAIFSITTLGLTALAVQLWIQQSKGQSITN